MPTILLVDDETALTRVLKEGLEYNLESATVHTAASYEEAMRLSETLSPVHCLIVDYHLGERTGIELCVDLGQRHPSMGTLVYTGKATSEVEDQAKACGAKVLWKPQRLQNLVAAVRECLPHSTAP